MKSLRRLSVYLIGVASVALSSQAQFKVDYNPSVQPPDMQYFAPAGGQQFVGDCIPFYHDGVYYLYWLLDEGHHSALNGLGGHQWVLSTTKDLKNWTHHPIAIGIDEEWEKSICTGSVAFYNNQFYAFYATRLILENGTNEQLSYAISKDGIHYNKQKPNPFYTSAPGYSKRNFRDPKVVIDNDGTFHLFVSSEVDNYVIREGRGVLVHLTSKDLKKWDVQKPILSGQVHVPECPDYFKWNEWYYLVYGQGLDTYYVKSKNKYGPWEYPESQALIESWVNVVKTAEFPGGRRIAAGWIASRRDNRDNGGSLFGGNVVLRELKQLPNGDLATFFPEEVIPKTGTNLDIKPVMAENARQVGNNHFRIDAQGAIGGIYMKDIPVNCRITLEIEPVGTNQEYGLFLRNNKEASEGYKLCFAPNQGSVYLHNTSIHAVSDLNKKIKVDIIMKDDLIDVSVNSKRCIINRLPEKKGDYLWLYAKQGSVVFKNIQVAPIL